MSDVHEKGIKVMEEAWTSYVNNLNEEDRKELNQHLLEETIRNHKIARSVEPASG